MKLIKTCCLAAVCGTLVLASPALYAAEAKTYQVTGPVLEATDTTITVQKGDDKWQIARDKNTRIDGQLKVGARVTIHYRMVATDVEVKGDKRKQ